MEKDIVQVTHEVNNYEEWRKGFDSDTGMRESQGMRVTSIFTDAENPNKVTALLEVDNLENAKKFISDPRLKEAMQKAGVTSPPEIRFMKKR